MTPPKIPFPLETLFPGIHVANPAIAAMEGEAFLAHGHLPDGFDLSNPDLRMRLLNPAAFIGFQIVPLPPAIAARVAKLPEDWQERPETHAEAEAINTAIEAHYDLAPRFSVSLNERREAWVDLNRAAQ